MHLLAQYPRKGREEGLFFEREFESFLIGASQTQVGKGFATP